MKMNNLKMTKEKEKIIELLKVLFETYPNMRAGQIIINSTYCEDLNPMYTSDLFYAEDEDFIEMLKKYINKENLKEI